MSEAKKTNGAAPTKVTLTQEECLQIQVLNLQRDNVQITASRELDRIEARMKQAIQSINARVGLGFDISKCRVDYNTCLATLDQAPGEESQQILPGLPASNSPPS